MHAKHVAHKDLKLENVRLTPGFDLRLVGLQSVEPAMTAGMLPRDSSSVGGTRAYAAPEAIRKQRHDPIKADMWSLGVLLFCMVMGRPPCRVAEDCDPWYRVIKARDKRQLDEFWTKHVRASKIRIDQHAARFRSLIEGLLHVDPNQRMDVRAVMRHPWVCTVCPPVETCRGVLQNMCNQIA